MSWNAWRELRYRRHIRLGIVDLPDQTGGAVYARRGDRAAILLDRRLDRQQRHAALAHELVHDERGGGASLAGMPDTWGPRVVVDELQVDREVARRLVPVHLLAEFCDRMADLGEGVSPEEVAAEFDVTREVAVQALDNLTRHERKNR